MVRRFFTPDRVGGQKTILKFFEKSTIKIKKTRFIFQHDPGVSRLISIILRSVI